MLEAWSSLKKSLHCSKTHSTEVHDPSRTRHHNKSSDHRKNKQSNKESSSSTTSQASRSAILNPVTHEIVFDNNSKKFCCCSIPQNNDEDGSKGVELVSHRSTKRTIISEKTHCVDCDQCGFFSSKPRVPKVKMMVQEYSPENPKSMEIVDDEDDISVENSVILLHKEDSSWQIIEKLCQTSCYTNSASNATDIECVLKVHNHHKSFSCFEECREIARTNAEKLQDKFPATRCLADGNELLRFHGTTIACSLGMNNNDGSSSPTTTSLCTLDQCGLCQILRHGFSTTNQKWVFTTSTSEKAYDFIDLLSSDELSMRKGVIVCRVIAGRIHNPLQENEEITSDSGFDTLVKKISAESDIEELYVLNPRAILPCFVEQKCIVEIKDFLLHKASQEKGVADQLRLLLEEQACDVGLLVSQRVVNLPPQLLPPLYNALFDEVSWATEDEPTEDLRNSFKFKHYVILSKIYKHKNVEQKRKVSNDSDEAIIYIKPEDEIFQKLSSRSFIFPLQTQQPAPHELKNYRPMGLVMAVEADKIPKFRQELVTLISET